MRLRIQGASIITLDDEERRFESGQITWDAGTIVSIGPEDSDPSPVDQLLRVSHGYVLPGLLNGHNHAAMSLLRGLADDSPLLDWLHHYIFPVEAKLTADDVYIGTMLACAEMIHSGTVGFADMYFHVDAVAQAVEDSGMRGWIARGITGDIETGMRALGEGVEFANRWASHRRIVPMLGPHAPYTVSMELAREIARRAAQDKLGIHIHLGESPEEMTELARVGENPVSWAEAAGLFESRVLIAHGTQFDGAQVERLRGMVGGVVACPVSNAKLGNGIMPYALLKTAGVPVGLGSDGAASTNSLDMFLEMKAMAWFQKLLNRKPESYRAMESLQLATRGTARVLGHPGGVLAVGQPADFIMVESRSAGMVPDHDVVSNLVYATNPGDVRYVVIDGQVVMSEGIITTFDEREIINQALARAQQLTL